MRAAVDAGDLRPDPEQPWNALISTLYRKNWNVYCKHPFAGPPQVVDYIGRYTHRVAISNRRITGFTDEAVFLQRRDPDHPSKTTGISLPPLEFIRRFLQHVLPAGFVVKIRHYGMLANRNRRVCIARARLLLCIHPEPEPSTPTPWHELLCALTGTDPFTCPFCKQGTLLLKAQLLPSRAPPPKSETRHL